MVGQTGRAPDRRVRLAAKPSQKNLVYGEPIPTNIMYPLHPNAGGSPNGMIWPYTPNVTYQQNVQYDEYDLTHVNQSPQSYKKTDTLTIEVVGDFTVQNDWEGRYVLACMHFLSTVTKIQYGINSDNPGTPPPVLHFSAYGNLMFDRIPVVVKSFNIALTPDVDYVRVTLPTEQVFLAIPNTQDLIPQRRGNEAWIPSKVVISASLAYNPAPQRVVNEFNWQSFRDGSLLRNRGGYR
jgi:hypothetical protein